MKKLVKMIDISNINSTLVITSDYPYAFPFEDGQLTVPVNSITYSIDSSDYIAFRSAANNDVLFTGTLGLISINGTKVNREEFIDQFNAIAYAASGSGSGGAINVIEMTQAEYDALETYENAFYIITDAETEWVGTQAEYDALSETSDKITYYIIEE